MEGRTSSPLAGPVPRTAFEQAAALHVGGNLAAAEQIYRAILKQHPEDFAALYNLAVALIATSRCEEAVQLLRQALNRDPKSAIANVALARALQELRRDEEAVERAKRAVALDARSHAAQDALASGLAVLGRYDDALRAQARAIELAPNRPLYYYHWGAMARWSVDDPRLATLAALEPQSLSPDDQVYFNFALAKACADRGDIERSFRHQIEGGALWRRAHPYDEAATHREFDELRRTFDAAWIERHKGIGETSSLPVFVVGMPRSGTTLTAQIMASHPKMRSLGEYRILAAMLGQLAGTPLIPEPPAATAARWPDSQLRRLGTLYLDYAKSAVPAAAARAVDKVPSNFQYLGLIHAALPNARIIHIRRDPVDNCLSLFSIVFPDKYQLYSYDLGELGRYYRGYEKVMAHWREVLPPGVMLEVRYEDIVDDLEREARRIIAHCGLDWDERCLSFYKTKRPIRTASHAQVRQPIYRSSVGRARPPRELLLPLLQALELD